ncbi:virulence factor TspB C-terminal domain-related protein [Alkanindiges sp. WGS2144]|uniref:virulence factor TspB C-terminal domain-related protein n=1 Tax=Alkanindiges sp. WGS2144 TaxID=3366808 RepID=UPI00375353F6
MANSSNNGSSGNNFIAKALTYILAFYIALFPVYVHANAAFGGWTVVDVVASSSTAVINATKQAVINGSARTVKSFARVPVSAANILDGMGKGGAIGFAAIAAVEALLAGVDYVLDPANNRAIIRDYTVSGYDAGAGVFATQQDACNARARVQGAPGRGVVSGGKCKINYESGSVAEYDINPVKGEPKDRYVPYDQLARDVVNAANGQDVTDYKDGGTKSPTSGQIDSARRAIEAVADPRNYDNERNYPFSPSVPRELESNTGVEDQAGDRDIDKTDPNNPNAPTEKFKLPAFCSWASFICNAMNISNANSGRAASASEQNVQQTARVATATQEMKGELVNNGQKMDEMKGAVVNAASAVNTLNNTATEIKGELVNNGQKTDQAKTEIKGELVNNGTKIDNAATEIKGELVNQGSAISDAISNAKEAIKDLVNPAIDSLINAITGIKDAITSAVDTLTGSITGVKDAVNEGTAENTRIGTQAHSDAVANKEATEENTANDTRIGDIAHSDATATKEAIKEQTAKDEAHREWVKEAPAAEDGLVNVSALEIEVENPNINFGAQCPAPFTTSVTIMNNAVPMEFSYQPLCSFMQSLRPFVIGSAYILGAYIVAGTGRGGATDG